MRRVKSKRERERQRQRQRQTDRQTDRQIDRDRDRQTDRQTDRAIIIITMYIHHALINALSAHTKRERERGRERFQFNSKCLLTLYRSSASYRVVQ